MEEKKKSYEELMYQKMVMLNRFHTQDKVELLNALKDHYGEDVFKIVEKVESEKAFLEWRHIANQNKDHSIEAFLRLMWEPLKAKGFLYTSEIGENGIQMRCTKCPVFDMAKEMNATKLMYHHTCSVDGCIASGFNAEIGFRRTKTLMQGDDCCDHYYYMK